MTAASGSASTKWGYPYGSIADQATFCTTASQATLKTCIEAIFTACNANAKSLKMFSTDGANLVTAYASLCSNTLVTDAQACMSSTTVATYTAAESTFTTAVENLNIATTSTEICGLATTLKFTGYTELLTGTCTAASHLAVWAAFYDTVLDTYLCSSCTSRGATIGRRDTVPLLELAVVLLVISSIQKGF